MKWDIEKVTFKKTALEYKYRNLYGDGDYEEVIRKKQKKLLKQYILIILIFFLAIGYGLMTKDNKPEGLKEENGKIISVDRPKEGEAPVLVNTKIIATKGGSRVLEDKEIFINPIDRRKEENGIFGHETNQEILERRIGNTIYGLNRDKLVPRIILPTELEDGTKLQWIAKEKSMSPLLIPGLILALFLVYRGRFEKIRKEEQEARKSIVHHLPEFINKLVLLLNGGIVLQKAFEKIMEDYETMKEGEGTYFYNHLYNIYKNNRETNSSMYVEFRKFAKRSGVRELMRISNIIADNVSKGSDLAVKLQREGEALWFARKKQSEEKGRLAETKLTLPLMILLLVLVMVTISPALMDM